MRKMWLLLVCANICFNAQKYADARVKNVWGDAEFVQPERTRLALKWMQRLD